MNQDVTHRRQKDGKRGRMCSRNTGSGAKDGGLPRSGKKTKEVETDKDRGGTAAHGTQGRLENWGEVRRHFKTQDQRAQGVSSPRGQPWRINWKRAPYPRLVVFRHLEIYLFTSVHCVPGTGKGTLFLNKILHRTPLCETENNWSCFFFNPLWFILYNTLLKSSTICTQKLHSQEATKCNTKDWSKVFALKAMQKSLLCWSCFVEARLGEPRASQLPSEPRWQLPRHLCRDIGFYREAEISPLNLVSSLAPSTWEVLSVARMNECARG